MSILLATSWPEAVEGIAFFAFMAVWVWATRDKDRS